MSTPWSAGPLCSVCGAIALSMQVEEFWGYSRRVYQHAMGILGEARVHRTCRTEWEDRIG